MFPAPARSPIRRRLASRFAPLGLLTIVALGAATPAFAVGNNGSNMYFGDYGVTAMASVACDAGNGTMTVSAQTTPMQAYGFAGPTTGPYDGGQWVRYNVFARDIEVSTWTPVYTWSAWQWVPGAVSTMYVERLTVPADLGSNVVDGTPGHNYAVLVQIDYWTGAENIGNVEPEYTQTYQADAFNTYALHPGYCHL